VESPETFEVLELLHRLENEKGLLENLAMTARNLAYNDLGHEKIHSIFKEKVESILTQEY
jgi:hypothetical protein